MTELQNQLVDELNLAGFNFTHAEFNDDGDGKWSFDAAFRGMVFEITAQEVVRNLKLDASITHYERGLMRIESN